MHSLKENLPKEVRKEKFTEFLDKIKEDFPSGELFVQYQEINGKVIVLGIGKNSDCATQVAQLLVENPEFKRRKLNLIMLRPPKTGLLVR